MDGMKNIVLNCQSFGQFVIYNFCNYSTATKGKAYLDHLRQDSIAEMKLMTHRATA